MKIVSTAGLAVLAALVWQAPARAQTPQQIQGMIANGQEGQALAALQPVLAAHPDSGVGWYLTAEAQDVAGHEDAARAALAKAQQYAPGLPFADPSKAAALQAHLNPPAAAGGDGGISPLFIGIGILLVAFFVLRRMLRGRRQYMAPGGFPPGYGPGGMPYGGGGGGGLGGSILGGLAAGAGFAAGERIFDDVTGGGNNSAVDPAYGADPAPRDDGLNGAPGWDDNNNGDGGGGFDPGNNW